MRRFLALAGCAFFAGAISTTAAAQADAEGPVKVNGPFWTRGEWLVSATEDQPEPSGELQRGKWGKPILVVAMAPWKVAVTSEAVSLISPNASPKNYVKATYTIPAGTRLFPMTARLGKRSVFPQGGSLFCTQSNPDFPGLFVGIQQRACLVDDDQDGDFDRAATAGGSTIWTNYSDTLVSEATPLHRSLPYSLEADRPEVVQVAIMPYGKGNGRLRWGPLVDGKIPVEGEKAIDVVFSTTAIRDKSKPTNIIGQFGDAELPYTIEVAGLAIEIVASDSDGITYRILSGFDPKQPVRYYWSPKFPE